MRFFTLIAIFSACFVDKSLGTHKVKVPPQNDPEAWADYVRHSKIKYVKDTQDMITKFMKDNPEDGKTICTNRTNPLAPGLQPRCRDEDGRKLAPVCENTNFKPDAALGCIVLPEPGGDQLPDQTLMLTKIVCPSRSRTDLSICENSFKPVFIPNERQQRRQDRAIVVCRSPDGLAEQFPSFCDVVHCKDGSQPDPCIGCLDRSEPRCRDGSGCPAGFEARVMTSPYQCSLPYR